MVNWKVFRGTYEYVLWDSSRIVRKDLQYVVVQVETLKTIMRKECKQILNRLGLTEAGVEQNRSRLMVVNRARDHYCELFTRMINSNFRMWNTSW